jgi:hypothetical protein
MLCEGTEGFCRLGPRSAGVFKVRTPAKTLHPISYNGRNKFGGVGGTSVPASAFARTRVARFFRVQHTKTGNIYQKTNKYTKRPWNIPNCQKIYQMAKKSTKWPKNLPNGQKIYQMAIKYIYQHFPLLDPLKLGYLVWKYTIWQPCPGRQRFSKNIFCVEKHWVRRRVTRLGEFCLPSDCLLRSFFENYKRSTNFMATFSTVKVMY